MFQKQLLIFLICFNLVFPLESFAAPAVQNPFAGLLIQHRDIKIGVGSMELLNKHGKALANATFNLIKDPRNKRFLTTPEGIELTKHQELLTNYLAIKNHFDKCIKDKNAKRKLQDRILQASFQGMSNLDASPCPPPNVTSVRSYEEFNNNVMKAMKTMIKPNFQNLLSKKVMTNTAKSLLAFRQKFNPEFMKSGKLSNSELDKIVSDVCVKKAQTARIPIPATDVCQKMDPLFKNKLKRELILFAGTQSTQGKMSPEKTMRSLNESIDRLNAQLAKVEVRKDVGFIYDSADLSDESSKRNFNNYINQYVHEVSKDAGALLLTKTMKDQAGSIRRYDSDDTSKNSRTAKFQFDRHKRIRLDDVNKSINEAEFKMMDQARDTLAIAYKSTAVRNTIRSDDDDIADLVKINPFAVGQILIQKPEYAGLACDSINNINQTDANEEDLDKYFMIGSAVIGGALVLTGVGAAAGAYLITGSVTAGLAAGTIGGSILGYSALAGTAVELVSFGYNAKRANDHYREMNQLEYAYMTKNSDAQALTDAKDSLIKFKEARLMAGLSLAGVGLNLVNVSSVFNIFKTGRATTTELNAATKILKSISDTRVASKLRDILRVLGSNGSEKLNNFFLHLAKTSETNRIKFLELLKDSRITPEKFKEIIESSLNAANKCSKA